jgi:hypothetical protein
MIAANLAAGLPGRIGEAKIARLHSKIMFSVVPNAGTWLHREGLMMQARLFLAIAAPLLAVPSVAQASAPAGPRKPVRIRATIEKFDDNMLTVKTEKGGELTLAVTPKTNISGVAARKLTDIKPNDFIGVTAMEGTDNKLHATEVHIFPEAMRGAGEGHHPTDKGPDSSMTNAAVAGMVDSIDGKTFTLRYNNKATGTVSSTDIDVSPTIPVVAFTPGDPSLLQPGAHTVMFVLKEEDGDLIALNIVAEKDGVRPPM